MRASRRSPGPRVVVVTGGTAGVGRAAAEEFARRGDAVAVLARGQERLDATSEALSEQGARCLAIPVDVADAGAVEAAAERVEAELGPIDVWVNNAMTSVFSPVAEVEAHEVERVAAVNYLGSVNGALAALRRMLPRERGHHRAGRLGAGLPRHPAPGCLLRAQVRHQGVRGTRCAASCATTAATCGSRRSTCRR